MEQRRVRLSERELHAILCVANDADAAATTSSITDTEEDANKLLEHFDSGMDKLSALLASRRRARLRKMRR